MSDPEVADVMEKSKQTITSGGGEIVSQEVWGRRKLLHMIGKSREGIYLYLKYRAAPGLLTKMDHNFKVADHVLRHSFTLMRERKVKEKKVKKPKPAAV